MGARVWCPNPCFPESELMRSCVRTERPFAPVGLSAEEIALLEEELDYASHSAPPGEHENDTSHPEVVFLVRVRSAFSSVANLELSCRTADGTISLDSIHKLYGLVMKRPPVLAALRERIEGLLRRPGNKIHESDGGWCCVLLEAPVFHSNGSPEAVQRAWLVSRLIGLLVIFSLPPPPPMAFVEKANS